MRRAKIPYALAEAFKDRSTITAPELCQLLPMDEKLLKKHIEHCNIEHVEAAADASSLLEFTLEQVLDFIRICKPRW